MTEVVPNSDGRGIGIEMQPEHTVDRPSDTYATNSSQDRSIILTQAQASEIYKLASQLILNYELLRSIRERTLLVRDQASYQRKFCESKEDFVRESEDALATALVSEPNASSVGSKSETQQGLREQLLNDRLDLRQEVDHKLRIEWELNQLEYRMQKPEQVLYAAAQGLTDLFQQWKLPEAGIKSLEVANLADSTQSSRDKADSDHAALEARYYDASEEVSFMHQHLVQIELDHREARVNTVFREDQGLTPTTIDGEVEAAYLEESSLAERDFLDAVRKAKLIRTTCVSEGLKLKPHPIELVERIIVSPADEKTSSGHREDLTAHEPFMDDASVSETNHSITFSGQSRVADTALLVCTEDTLHTHSHQRIALNKRVERWRDDSVRQRVNHGILFDTSDTASETPQWPATSVPSIHSLKRWRTFSSSARQSPEYGATSNANLTRSVLKNSLSVSDLSTSDTSKPLFKEPILPPSRIVSRSDKLS